MITGIEALQSLVPLNESYQLAPLYQTQFEAMLLDLMLKGDGIDDSIINPFIQTEVPETHEFTYQTNSEISEIKTNNGSRIAEPNVDQFVNALWPYLQKTAAGLGLDPKLLLAQAALETGWGKFILKDAQGNSTFNFFNIKTSTPENSAVSVTVTEFVEGKSVELTDQFKAYASPEEGLQGYSSLIQNNPRYEYATSKAHSPEQYIHALQDAGYATDPHYANKVLSIYKGQTLKNVLERNHLV